MRDRAPRAVKLMTVSALGVRVLAPDDVAVAVVDDGAPTAPNSATDDEAEKREHATDSTDDHEDDGFCPTPM